MKYITKTVWVLSLVSLLTDVASEMLYPVMPVYLKSIGFSVVMIGVLEGIAETIAGLSKGYFGKRSDLSGRRVPFVQLGYALSAISRPMMAIFVSAFPIFIARTLDRFGKGIRTGARDAMLSDEATPETRGRVFGFHRSMDTLGAVIGPMLALLYLLFFPNDYRNLFFIAFIPGLFASLFSFFLKDKHRISKTDNQKSVSLFYAFTYWKKSSTNYRKLVGGLLAFALFNSSDVFLLLKMKESGLNDTGVIGVYIFYNFVYALFAFPMGHLADKLGLKKLYLSGILLFATVYLCMSVFENSIAYFFVFLLYGLYSAATEGITKAWISNITPSNETATALGSYAGFQSISAFLASSLTGVIWYQFGSPVAFGITGVAALLLATYFIKFVQAPVTLKDA